MPTKDSPHLEDSLLEIGTEEIPAGYILPALEFIKSFCARYLTEKQLDVQSINTYGTPRRLTVIISGVPPKSRSITETVTGPSLKAAKNEQGEWTQAARGFAQSQKVSLEQLEIKKTERGDYISAVRKQEGTRADKILAALFAELLPAIPFPKKMTWNSTRFKFARPIRSLVSLYGKKVIPLNIAGVKSTSRTRPMAHLSSEKITIAHPQKYLVTLKNHCILAEPDLRRKAVQQAADQCAQRAGGEIHPDPSLIEEIVWLVEHPVAVLGNFDPEFLKVPAEVLVTCMKKHQRFLPLYDKKGNLLPHFIAIRNGISTNQKSVQEGYEKVLNARLNDARFFFAEDLKKPLEHHIARSGEIQIHDKLGKIKDKLDRMTKTADWLCQKISADATTVQRGIQLCKFDLGTSMVYEFPELQGIVGSIYARHYNEPAPVSQSVKEHYYPLTVQSELPRTLESSAASFLDKLDNLIGSFLVGAVPTGSADPYGLKRQAAGILRIALDHKWELSIHESLKAHLGQFAAWDDNAKRTIEQNLVAFLVDRFQLLMQDAGFELDEIYAVTKNSRDPDTRALNLIRMKDKIAALHTIRSHPDFGAMAITFKRTVNILKQARSKNLAFGPGQLKQEMFKDASEGELNTIIQKVAAQTGELMSAQKYAETFQTWVTLRQPLDLFFEKVMVMDPDPAVCANRLSILSALENLFLQAADLSQIQQKSPTP